MSEDARSEFVQKERDASKLTKMEISSILLRHFSTEVENIVTTKKAVEMEKFNAVFQKTPDLLFNEGESEYEGVGSDGTTIEGSDDDENELPSGVFPVMEI